MFMVLFFVFMGAALIFHYTLYLEILDKSGDEDRPTMTASLYRDSRVTNKQSYTAGILASCAVLFLALA